MIRNIFVFLALTAFYATADKRVKNRLCPTNIVNAQNFDIKSFGEGDWIELFKTDNPHQPGKKCGRIEPVGVPTETSATFKDCTKNDGPEDLCITITFTVLEPEANNGKISVYIKEEDRTVYGGVLAYVPGQYMISYECKNVEGGKSEEHIWSFAKEGKVTNDVMKSIKDAVRKNFGADDIKSVNNAECKKN